MNVKGNAVRSLAKMLPLAHKHPQVRFIVNMRDSKQDRWVSLGFKEVLETGQMLVPASVGKVSTFNAHGKEVVRKDIPKHNASFASFRTWKDWHGQEHSGIQHRDMMVYQREHLAAPSEALYVIETTTGLSISTRAINLSKETDTTALHLANLMLECFGEFDVVDATSGVQVGAKLKRLQWEILPAGKYPWSKAGPIVMPYTKNLGESARELVRYRMTTIAGHSPDFLATGTGGFNAYFVYGFEKKGLYVLESGYLDNATYVFKQDWEAVSQLTKSEIINGGIPHTRIVHDNRWRHNINTLLKAA
jgi:hypothetical protein